MDWAQVLVIILSIFLAIFLVVSIILVVMLIRVTRQIKGVVASAEKTAIKAEAVVSNFSAATSPSSVAKVVSAFVKNFKR